MSLALSRDIARRVAVAACLVLVAGCGSGRSTKAGVAPAGKKAAGGTAALVPDLEPTTTRVLSCGRERWPVKTGSDADATAIDLTAVQQTTIAALTSLPEPPVKPQNNRAAPVETTVYEVSATLTEFLTEKDSDHHLVLDDGQGHHMIAEVPSPSCVAASSPILADIARARATFDAVFSRKSGHPNAHVVVRGVGFFDLPHPTPQHGVAPNNIELHPVLAITFAP